MKILEDIIFYKKVRVIDTSHSTERYLERNTDITINDLNIIIKRGIDKLKGYAENNHEYLIYSNQFERGLILKYKKYKKHDIIVIITYLPKNKSIAKLGTEKIIVEKHKDNIIAVNEHIIDYLLDNIVFNSGYVLNDSLNKAYLGSTEVSVFILDNKLYDISSIEIVEV